MESSVTRFDSLEFINTTITHSDKHIIVRFVSLCCHNNSIDTKRDSAFAIPLSNHFPFHGRFNLKRFSLARHRFLLSFTSDVSCFQGLLFCPEAYYLLLHNFCIYHISPPGHELGAVPIDPDYPILSVDDLADQIAEVLNFFGLSAVMCMGVTAGAYVLTLFAMKYRQRVLGLILVSPLCKEPSWAEWLYNKVMSNLLYFYGMCGVVKEILLKRYFSKEIRGGSQLPESDIVKACRRLLDERQSLNVWRFLEAINGRPDISEGLRKLQCRSLIFVGDMSPFHSEALHMTSKLDRRFSALVEVLKIVYQSVTRLCNIGIGFSFTISAGETTGSSMWVNGNRGAASCDVNTDGVLSDGIWLVQAIEAECQPKKPLESILHISRALLPREYGFKIETHKDTNFCGNLDVDGTE
ncbi:hypothetical protein V8G54_034784 [Vigna mungo]|uniref:Pollen-specific protein SF21 n=1 Tax=Vigna mungo TaxID=3915 RepID=A0AAQ3ME18_VIGMU